jgi:hypothetical protein
MSPTAKSILERVASWPEQDQEELAEVAREIEARRAGIYELTPEEEAAIHEGIADLNNGRWVSEEEMRDFWKRCGVL